MIDRLSIVCGTGVRLNACNGHLNWPKRGVYFFMEDGEDRSESGNGPRIVRVGTHALRTGSSTSLWARLSQHRGPQSSGGGNHRGSIFRLLVGTALAARDGDHCPTWDDRRSVASPEVRAAELEMERKVSAAIGTMSLLWLAVDDDPAPQSARGDIERNAIALLSNLGKAPLDPPSASWLGHHCDRERVRGSGLWNNNHVDEKYDPAFLERMNTLLLAVEART
ncbi:hypothetical protein [Acuticoccus kandeliae]|uniref:hypothetical protein n=1 Tax=Acuticoccus kandeliae TaxID=2073160 RepID=UPI00196B3223|nr:hypothetical protein [Acuticoccus kandeliae]